MEDAYGEIGHHLRSAGHVGNNSCAGNHVNLQRPSERPVALWLYLHSPELNEAARWRRRQRPLPPPRPPSFPVSATSHGGKESQNGVLSVVASVRSIDATVLPWLVVRQMANKNIFRPITDE